MILLNGAGTSAADPILRNLGYELILASTSMDVAAITDEWLDQASGIPGTSSIKASLSPAATVVTAGNSGTYSDTTKRWTISSTTGLTVGDYIYFSHASITAGIFKIASIPASGDVTLVGNPLNGLGDKTGIAYQVAWKYDGVMGTSPTTSDAGGDQNYAKARTTDPGAVNGDKEEDFYIRDAPSGSSFIAIDSKDYTGQTTSDSTPSFVLLSGWTNNGGVTHVELANHSGAGVNNFQWGDGTTSEKTLAAAESGGFLLSAGDGVKQGRILLKSKASAAVTYGVDISITLDTAGPVLTFTLVGR